MRIVIAGCGRVGSDLARSLADSGHDVSVIDTRSEAFAALGTTFNGTTHTGLAYDIALLRSAGIELADAFIATTRSDNANLMAVQLVTEVFSVPQTIARLDDPARAESYRALGVRYVAGSELISKVMHEDVVDEEFRYHVTFSGGDVEVVEMILSASADGVTVSEFEVEGVRVAAVRRGSETFVPVDDSELREGDLVVAATRSGTRGKLRRYLVRKRR